MGILIDASTVTIRLKDFNFLQDQEKALKALLNNKDTIVFRDNTETQYCAISKDEGLERIKQSLDLANNKRNEYYENACNLNFEKDKWEQSIFYKLYKLFNK